MSTYDPSLSGLNGRWSIHSIFNDRPVYARNPYFMFYTETDGPKRWVVESTIGTTRSSEGAILHGYLRYEGDVNCPEFAGNSWSQIWNQYVVDSSITVQCGKYP